jgi:hypothetical protein
MLMAIAPAPIIQISIKVTCTLPGALARKFQDIITRDLAITQGMISVARRRHPQMSPQVENRFGLLAHPSRVLELLLEDGLRDVCGRGALAGLGCARRGGGAADGTVGRTAPSEAGI